MPQRGRGAGSDSPLLFEDFSAVDPFVGRYCSQDRVERSDAQFVMVRNYDSVA